MKITIEFDVPAQYHAEEDIDVNIIGTFTQWIPQQMEKCESFPNRYLYQSNMQRGFKHRYQFLVNGNEHIDESKKSSVNFTESKTNYVMVPLLSLEKLHKGDISAFMCQDIDSPALLDYPSFVPEEIAKMMKKESSDNSPDDNSNITEFVVSKMQECSQILDRKNYLKERIDDKSVKPGEKQTMQSQHKALDTEYCKIGRILKKVLLNRIVHTKEYDSTIFEIADYVSSQNNIKARRVYDQNKILLEPVHFGNYVTYSASDVENKLQFLSIREEASIRMEMLKDGHIFKIKYQIDTSTGENE